jgi:predicted transcriptional regulator
MGKRLVKRGRPTVTVTLEKHLLKRVDSVARALALSRSRLLEQLVRDGIEEQETWARALANPLIAKALGLAIGQPGVLKAMAEAMGEELRPEQMELFKQAMQHVVSLGAGEPVTLKGCDQ